MNKVGLLLLLISVCAFADNLQMNDGRIVEGKIIHEYSDYVEFKKPDISKTFKVLKKNIAQINEDQPPQKNNQETQSIATEKDDIPLENFSLSNGQRVKGTKIGQNDENNIVKLSNGKIIFIPK